MNVLFVCFFNKKKTMKVHLTRFTHKLFYLLNNINISKYFLNLNIHHITNRKAKMNLINFFLLSIGLFFLTQDSEQAALKSKLHFTSRPCF